MRINEITLIQVNAGLEGTTPRLLDDRPGRVTRAQLPTATAPEVPTSHGVQPSIRFPPVYSGGTHTTTDGGRSNRNLRLSHTYRHRAHLVLRSLLTSLAVRCLHPQLFSVSAAPLGVCTRPLTHCLTTIPPYS